MSFMLRAMSTAPASLGPLATAIRTKLEAALQPSKLVIHNDSHKHASHWVEDGSDASRDGETHFRLEIVSEAFSGVSAVKRHQKVYALLADEISAGVHALSMSTKTAVEQGK